MTILCIGDSLTYGYGVRQEETWCALASALTGYTFLNRGVNGALTGEMKEQPLSGEELMMMGGLNNLFMGMDITVPLRDLREIWTKALQMGMRPTVGIPMPISPHIDEGWCEGPIDLGKVRSAYAAFADELERFCAEDGVRIIDFRPLILPCHLSFDGIHLNKEGHRRMAEAVAACWMPKL